MRASIRHDLVITDLDLQRLLPVLDRLESPASDLLDAELHRAEVVPHRVIAPDVVTMNSEVVYQDTTTGARRTVRLVYPQDADAARGQISVVAPLGTALLGLRIGQRIDWPFPRGQRSIAVVTIPYQPESHGDYHL